MLDIYARSIMEASRFTPYTRIDIPQKQKSATSFWLADFTRKLAAETRKDHQN